VYAPLCLAPAHVIQQIGLDYLHKSTLDVYLDVARFSLSQPSHELDFLGYSIWTNQPIRPLPPELSHLTFPSWLPNWFQPVDIKPIPKTLYMLEKPGKEHFRFYDSRGIPKNTEEQTTAYKATGPTHIDTTTLHLQVQTIFCDLTEDTIPLTRPDSSLSVAKKATNWAARPKAITPTERSSSTP
jgi:hypothetical protein